ncbi:Predicted arabinose efflux permease, MFS family [Actinomyces ruminicola]|uniref:Predicted arabinose efflux permease, MFS family n=1 Tax=Actinomyces ruminicola TaxID=332524 RepID=A0A1H0DUW0_9ACTO|nr:MFS transporter [Actinomyces ruminicola]SDN73915.1 Predicted arabinose efflux permease, MFS family [Actinomyces ruminicola]
MQPSSSDTTTSPRMAVVVACVALFTDMLVYGILIPVLPLLPTVTEVGPSATGLLFAAYAAALVIVTPVAGRVVDRRGPRGPLLAALAGLACACLLFTIGGPYWLLLTARSLQGAAAGLSWVAGLSLIAATVPLQRRGACLGLAMSMVSVGVLAGPPLAGWLAELGGHSAPFLFAATLLMIDGALRLAFVRPTPPPCDDPATAMDVLRTPGCWSVVALILIGAAVTSCIEPVLPMQLAQGFGVGATGIGLLFALLTLVGACLNPLVGACLPRVSPRLPALTGVAAAATGLLLVGAGPNLPVIAAGLVCLGAAIALLVAPASALVGVQGAKATPPAIGGAYSLYNLAYAGGLFIGPTLSGTLTERIGFAPACLAMASLLVLSTAMFTRLPRKLAAMPG